MAKAGKAVPGLTFKHTIEARVHGRPVDGVEPLEFEWAGSFATEWHEEHQCASIRSALVDVRQRVRRTRADFTKSRRR